MVARLPAGAGAHGEVPLEGVLSVCGVEPGDLVGGDREWEGRGLQTRQGQCLYSTTCAAMLSGH